MENRIKIAVLGGGINGLVSAHSVKDIADVTLVSPELGGTWASGGLKVLKWHPWLEHLMHQLGVPFFLDTIQGAVWWEKRLLPLSKIDENIQRVYYKHTRGTMEGFDITCMNEKAGTERIIDFNYDHFVRISEAQLNCVKSRVVQIDVDSDIVWIDTEFGKEAFDYVLTTLPLWEMRKVASFWLPKSRCCNLNIAEMIINSPIPFPYHYVYFPKGKGPHRISVLSRSRKRWTMEMQVDKPRWDKAIKVVQELMPDARLNQMRASISGHLLPLSEPLEYPVRIIPLGRFASWNSRETVDKVAEKVLRFATGLSILRWRQL